MEEDKKGIDFSEFAGTHSIEKAAAIVKKMESKIFDSQADQLVRLADKMELADKGSKEWKAYNAEYKLILAALLDDKKKTTQKGR